MCLVDFESLVILYFELSRPLRSKTFWTYENPRQTGTRSIFSLLVPVLPSSVRSFCKQETGFLRCTRRGSPSTLGDFPRLPDPHLVSPYTENVTVTRLCHLVCRSHTHTPDLDYGNGVVHEDGTTRRLTFVFTLGTPLYKLSSNSTSSGTQYSLSTN